MFHNQPSRSKKHLCSWYGIYLQFSYLDGWFIFILSPGASCLNIRLTLSQVSHNTFSLQIFLVRFKYFSFESVSIHLLRGLHARDPHAHGPIFHCKEP